MTLSEMADYVCTKINQTEAEDVTACKTFLTQRHKMIWNDQLWKDSLVEYTQTLSSSGYTVASTWLPTKQILLLPSAIQRVIAIRTGERKLNVERPELYYTRDFDSFAATGAAAEFFLMSSCVWELDTGSEAAFALHLGEGADLGSVIDYTYVDDDGITVFEAPDQTVSLADQPLTGAAARMEKFSKPASTGIFYLWVNSTQVNYMFATDKTMPQHQRVRIVGVPASGTVVRVLGKRYVPTFTDNDEPAINGSDNLLLALGEHDMWRRSRQFGFAADLKEEIAGLFDQLKRIETVQQAHNIRLIPEGGYGGLLDWQGTSALEF